MPETPSIHAPAAKYQQWRDLTDFLNSWFYQPDTEALEIILATVAAHYLIEADPIWLFVVGAPGSGKTACLITAAAALPQTHILSDLTPNTFLSSYRGKDKAGLLDRMGSSSIVLFKDFTTFLSKRLEDRTAIAGQLREIYDGYLAKSSGMGDDLEWTGKMSVIAACTPAIERQWAILRDLGERFMTVRLPPQDAKESALSAGRQRGKEKHIRSEIRRLTLRFVDPPSLPKLMTIPEHELERIASLSEFISILRGHITRDTYGKREIIDFPHLESPTRIFKSLALLSSAHSALFRREDMLMGLRRATRLALDTIPQSRMRIMEAIPDGATVTTSELRRMLAAPKSSLSWHLQEMEALGILQTTTDAVGEDVHGFTKRFGELKERAGLTLDTLS